MLVAALTRDDAAVYRVSDDRAIVATVDFFTPIVDDPYTFGAIAATNALSDLYAMGATPLFALNIVAWPRDPHILDLVGDTVRGSVDKLREAGAFVLGGHSIDDPEPKFGMVAVGEARPDELLTNTGAQPGDRLMLTKPLGTGILSTALKRAEIAERDMTSAIQSMTTLNAGALAAIRDVGPAVHAVTDVTGFGLLGHLSTVLQASGVGARVFARSVPSFARVLALITAGAVPGGTSRNLEAARGYTTWAPTIDEPTRVLLCDAQTSGGLLVAVAPDTAAHLGAALTQHGSPVAAPIGEVVGTSPGSVEVLDAEA